MHYILCFFIIMFLQMGFGFEMHSSMADEINDQIKKKYISSDEESHISPLDLENFVKDNLLRMNPLFREDEESTEKTSMHRALKKLKKGDPECYAKLINSYNQSIIRSKNNK